MRETEREKPGEDERRREKIEREERKKKRRVVVDRDVGSSDTHRNVP